jgi:hypothetical protein
MSDVLEAAGSMGMVVAGLGGLGAVVALALAGLAFTKRRVPLAAFVFLPFAVCVLGALGAWTNAGSVLGSLSGLDAAKINETALAGLWQSVTIDWLSLWVAAGVLVLGTWCAGVGATLAAGKSEETALTPVSAASSAIGAIVGSIALGAYGVRSGLTTEAYMLAGVILVGGLGVAFASSRRALYEHAYRVAGMRFTAAACFAIAAFFASQAVSMGAQIAMFGPGGKANGEAIDNAVRMWSAIADPVFTMSIAAFLIALVIAFLGMYSELGEIVQRYTLIDVWATIVLVLVLVAARAIESSNTTALADVGTHMPATQIFDSWGTDLPSAVVTVEREPHVSRPVEGGYGDVLAFRPYVIGYKEADGAPVTRSEWRRIWKWTGSSWTADDSPLSCEGNTTGTCTVATIGTERTPLLAIGKGETASDLMIAAKAVPDAKFMLLLKALDSDAGAVPSQLAHGQVTFIEIHVAKDVDIMKEIWVDAGYKEMFWGPTHWFGEGEDKDPVLYAEAIVADTESPGVHVLVSPKARVEGVANSCVAAAVHFEDGETSPSGIWCSVVEADVEDWRAKAREVWPIPEPEMVEARVVKIEGPVDNDHVTDVFLRETGAVEHCQKLAYEKALEDYDPDDEDAPMAPTDGRMEFSVVINDRGRINGTYTQDTSKLDNREIAGCVAKRYRKLSFDPLPKPPVVEGEPKPEPPTATIYINYDFGKLPDPEE